MLSLRALAERVAASRGYTLKIEAEPLRRAPAFFDAARGWGLEVGTVIDVGVGNGTPWLMDSFPDAYTVLVEPNPGFRPVLDRILTAPRRGEGHIMAAGAAAGEMTMHVNIATPTSSSLMAPTQGQVDEFAKRGWTRESREEVVPVARLDSLDRSKWPGPYLLKMDCEGFELEVMRGATGLLGEVALIVSEVGVAHRHEGSYTFAEFIAAMDAHGFELIDVTDLLQFGKGGHLATMDAAFAPKGGPLVRR